MRPIVLPLLFIILNSCTTPQDDKTTISQVNVKLLTKKESYVASETINLVFATEVKLKYKLIVSNAYGTSVITAKEGMDNLEFPIPKNYSRKSGTCHWLLIANEETYAHGQLNILPIVNSKPTLETYFGPRSITAGVDDYSMLVNVTTDVYDNVLPEGTMVAFKSQFLNSISEDIVASKDLISWKNIYTTKKSGRILVNTSFNDITSKELTTVVFPTLAENFEIAVERNHDYADGNQIMKLRTNVIKDKYDNIISDGTIVNFIIKNSKGAILNAMGATINGIAKATILHPSKKESWTINAYVTGAAKSNSLTIVFKAALNDFDVVFSNNNRDITIGPLRSFMNQRIPDGILIQMDVYNKSGVFVETKKLGSVKGFGRITMLKEYYPEDSYRLRIKVAGITKDFDVVFDKE